MSVRSFVLLAAVSLVGGCAHHLKVVTAGSFGPFSIGENKESALAKIELITDIRSITPEPFPFVHVRSPTSESLQRFDEDDGLKVFLDSDPLPLRVELQNNLVAKTWGPGDQCFASVPRMNAICREMARLQSTIRPGLARIELYKAIANFDTPHRVDVENFVVGYQEFYAGDNRSIDSYRQLLLRSNSWTFNGLNDLSKYSKPFYSRVSLYFSNNQLVKVTHWSAPHEIL